MKKFLVVLLPVILIGSLASIMFVAAQNISPCPVAWERPAQGWTQPATPASAMPGAWTGTTNPMEVWAVHHEWNEDGTALLARVRQLRGNESPFAPPHPLANPGGFVNIRNSNLPGGRAIPAEYLNVIAQVPAGTIVYPTGDWWHAWTAGGCNEWWVEVEAFWNDSQNRPWAIRGVMISSMLVCRGLLAATGNVEASTWTPAIP